MRAAAGTRDDVDIMNELPTILVAYASKHGSTREVAEAVATGLRERGWAVEATPAADVDDVSRYAGAVLGTALYTGRAHPDARRLLKRHHAALAGMPFAVFAMGPRTSADEDIAGARRQIDAALAHRPDVHPVAVAVFGGVIDPSGLHFPFSRMPASDARDWDAIRAFADEVADAFAPAADRRAG
jgi:menaquinone-dependent protoporphyrinogen oxidase